MKKDTLQKILSACMAFVFIFCSFGADALAAVLTLPSSTQVIGEQAFYGVTSLDEVVVPEGATEIQSGAFAHSSLNSIELPESLSYIADDAFEGVEGLTVTAPEGSYAAEWWEGQQTRTDFEYIITDGKCTITGYTGTENIVDIPAYIEGFPVVSIANHAFYKNTDLIVVFFPENLTTIESYAFSGCTQLSAIYFPASLQVIEQMAFADCTSLTALILSGEIQSLGENAFSGCIAMTNVSIQGDKIQNIGDNVFYGCNQLTRVELPDSIHSIANSAFPLNKNLLIVCSIYSYAAGWATDNGFSLECSDDVTPLSYFGFQPHSYRPGVGTGYAGIEKWRDPNGEVQNVVIPSDYWGAVSDHPEAINFTIESIDSRAFESCQTVKSITIPETVYRIRASAFINCKNLRVVVIPSSVTSISSYDIFEYCNNITIYGHAGSYAESYANNNNITFKPVLSVLSGEIIEPTITPTISPSPAPLPTPAVTIEITDTPEMRYVNQFFNEDGSLTELGLRLYKWLDMDERSVTDRLNSGYLMLEEEYLHQEDTFLGELYVLAANEVLEVVSTWGLNYVEDFANHAAMTTKFGSRGAYAVPYYQQLCDIYLSFLQSVEQEISTMEIALSTIVEFIGDGQIAYIQSIPETIDLIKQTPLWNQLSVSKRYALENAQKKLKQEFPSLETSSYQALIDEIGIEFSFASTAVSWYEVFANYQTLSHAQQLYMSAFSSATNDHLNALMVLRKKIHDYSNLSNSELANIDAAIGALICDIFASRNNHMEAVVQADWNTKLNSVKPLTNALCNTVDLFNLPILSFKSVLSKFMSLKTLASVSTVADIGSFVLSAISNDYLDFRKSTEVIYNLKSALTESMFQLLNDYQLNPTHSKAVTIINSLQLLKQMKLSGEEAVGLHYLTSYAKKLGIANSPAAMAILWNELMHCNALDGYNFDASLYIEPIETIYENDAVTSSNYIPELNQGSIDYTIVSTPIAYYKCTSDVSYQGVELKSTPSGFYVHASPNKWSPSDAYLKEITFMAPTTIVTIRKLGEEQGTTPSMSQSELEALIKEVQDNPLALGASETLRDLHLHRANEYVYRHGSTEVRISEEDFNKYLAAEILVKELLNKYQNTSALDYANHQIEERLIWTRITNGYINSLPMFDPYDNYLD